MSPVNTTPASGTWTIASPVVCAGPTSSRRTSRADAQVEPAVERRRGRAQLDALEGERAEDVAHVAAELGPEVRGLERGERLRRCLGHLGGGGRGGVELRGGRQELVAEAVVAVGVRVHRGVDRVAVGDRPHRVEHRARQVEVEQRVDEQRRAAGGDQPRVAPAPPAVGLVVRVEAVGQLVQALPVLDVHGRSVPVLR
jgi:hypothetical protein